MVEKGTIYHLAKLAGIMLGRLAIQERALDGPGDLILIAAVLVAGVIGYYEAANSLGSIVAMADSRTALGWQLGVAAGIFAAAIAIASIRAANFSASGG